MIYPSATLPAGGYFYAKKFLPESHGITGNQRLFSTCNKGTVKTSITTVRAKCVD